MCVMQMPGTSTVLLAQLMEPCTLGAIHISMWLFSCAFRDCIVLLILGNLCIVTWPSHSLVDAYASRGELGLELSDLNTRIDEPRRVEGLLASRFVRQVSVGYFHNLVIATESMEYDVSGNAAL